MKRRTVASLRCWSRPGSWRPSPSSISSRRIGWITLVAITTGRLASLGFGACIAQVTLIAAWAVFTPGNIVVRLPWSLLLGMMMWYVLVFGEQWVGGYNPRDILTLGVVLLLGVTVLQVPLWIAKRAFRYRMFDAGRSPGPCRRGPLQFQLKHLLLGTFLLSVALSPIRFALPEESVVGFVSGRQLRELLVLVPAVIVANLVATLPCLWGGFVSASKVWGLGAGWLVDCLIVTGTEFAVVCAILGHDDSEVFWDIRPDELHAGRVVFGVMRLYRTLGYSLERLPLPTVNSVLHIPRRTEYA